MRLATFLKSRFKDAKCGKCGRPNRGSDHEIEGLHLAKNFDASFVWFEIRLKCASCSYFTPWGIKLPSTWNEALLWAYRLTLIQSASIKNHPVAGLPTEKAKPKHKQSNRRFVLDCSPSQASAGSSALLTMGTVDGEVDCPVALDLNETRRLVIGCMAVLAHAGDATAAKIISNYFPGESWRDSQ